MLLLLCFITTSILAQTPNETITVSGKVVDQQQNPVAGASILVQEKKSGLTTGADGAFSFEASSNDQIIFQKEGFLTVSKSAGELNKVTVTLIAALIESGDLDNVQIPFGMRKKRELSATISTVNVSELPQLPLSTLNNALTGRLSGLYIQIGRAHV